MTEDDMQRLYRSLVRGMKYHWHGDKDEWTYKGYTLHVTYTTRQDVLVSVRYGKVYVNAPLNASKDNINRHVRMSAEWIDKALAKSKEQCEDFQDVLDMQKILFRGKKYNLVLSDKNELTDDTLYVESFKGIPEVISTLGKDDFLSLFDSCCKAMNLSPLKLYVKSFKSQWGSCEARGAIKLNYKLMMCPVEMQRYVMVHELAHLVHMDHSKQFWDLVARYVPDYKKMEAMEKQYSFLCEMYN